MLQEGKKAPDFTLFDQNRNQVSLSQFLGKKVVVYFYPRDNTPGCTKQACAFAKEYQTFQDAGIEVIGISKDSVASHEKFIAKYELPFLLLSDPDLIAIKGFGVWQEKKLYGKIGMGIIRSAFVISEDGVVEKVYEKVKPDLNAREILEYLGR